MLLHLSHTSNPAINLRLDLLLREMRELRPNASTHPHERGFKQLQSQNKFALRRLLPRPHHFVAKDFVHQRLEFIRCVHAARR